MSIPDVHFPGLNEMQLVEVIRIEGSYVVDSLPGGVFVITPLGAGEIKITKTSHEECKRHFLKAKS